MTREEWACWKATVPKGQKDVTYLRTDMLDCAERSFNWGQVQGIALQRTQIGAFVRGVRTRFLNRIRELREAQ